jgi:hypothetical protein
MKQTPVTLIFYLITGSYTSPSHIKNYRKQIYSFVIYVLFILKDFNLIFLSARALGIFRKEDAVFIQCHLIRAVSSNGLI